MYRTRIKKWGLDKKLKESEVLDIIHRKRQRDTLGKSSSVIIRNKKIPWSRIEKYIHRNPRVEMMLSSGELPVREIVNQVVCRTPTPEPAVSGPNSADPGWNEILHEVEHHNGPKGYCNLVAISIRLSRLHQLLRLFAFLRRGNHSGIPSDIQLRLSCVSCAYAATWLHLIGFVAGIFKLGRKWTIEWF